VIAKNRQRVDGNDAVLDAAVRVLSQRPRPAWRRSRPRRAWSARPSVPTTYPSRQALLAAVVERITGEVIAAIDAADLDADPATKALLRLA
jgi:AcrR family transcriptional regulator